MGGVGWGGAAMGEAGRKRRWLANHQEGLIAFTHQLDGWDETCEVSLSGDQGPHQAAWQELGVVQHCLPWERGAGAAPTRSNWPSEHVPEQQPSLPQV